MNDDSPYDIQINNKLTAQRVDESLLKKGIREALRRFNISRAEVSVAIVSDDEIAELHAKYLNINTPTDVLTFPLGEEACSSKAPVMIEGEIVISADTAGRCAKQRGHSTSAELALYAVHGTLHLVGLSDATKEQAGQMHQLEDDILRSMGLEPVFGG